MAPIQPDKLTALVVPSGALPDQTWANALHSTIIQAYKRKDILAFPESWTRLDSDPEKGIRGLVKELTPRGSMVAVFEAEAVVACGGFEPFRGLGWVNKEKSADEVALDGDASAAVPPAASTNTQDGSIKDWELCCFCVHPLHRRSGLSQVLLRHIENAVKQRGGQRLISNYSIDETGDYWPRMGFETLPGGESMLKKGFTHTVGVEGLKEDLHFLMGVKTLA